MDQTINKAEEIDPRFRRTLDHGHVRLVDSLGSDLSIVRAARVSYNAEWRSGLEERSDNRLIRYLLRNGHTSPFEHVSFTFDIKAPIFVLRQWHRHRTWSFNEVSARYTELPEEYYVPSGDSIGIQSKDNKQVREFGDNKYALRIEGSIRDHTEACFSRYKHLLSLGCPRELARMVLPLNTYSHMFATVDLHNLLHFLKLRLHEHAQYEIRVYAEAMLSLIEPIVPVSIAAWKEINDELFSNRHGGSDVQ
jgi:thymidylate synthase (FAD)